MRPLSNSINIRVVVFGLVVVCLFGSAAFGQPWDGNGVEGDPYQIWTAADMQAIGADSAYWGAHFELMADIDLGGYTGTSYNIIGNFTGGFEGNGHTISNFTGIKGLFNVVSLGGTIQNLGLIDPNVNDVTGGSIGSLAGELRERGATISGCYVEGGSVTGYSGFWCNAGGLVGKNLRGTITNCYSTASVSGDENVGGLCGDNWMGTITDCHSTGQVQGQRNSGGLVGANTGPITNCSSTASVSGAGRVGGLVGANHTESGALIKGIISNCYSSGQVQGGSRAGGLVGWNFQGGTINNCYSTASVSGVDLVGGLVGEGEGGNITNCYSTGSVSGTTDVGGLVGSGATVYSSFWDIQTSGEPNSAGGTGLTTAEMQDMNTFLGAGWDFVGEYENGPHDDWAQGSGGGYMILWWQVPENELPPLPTFSGGAGTESDPYLISNATDLNRIGHNGRLVERHFALISDIDLAGVDFFFIGSQGYPYSGVFNGNGHTISNFTYTSTGTDYIGLFRCVSGADAEVKNLGLINPSVEGGDYDDSFGSLVGKLEGGTITGCYTQGGSVTGTGDYIGGLVGYNVLGTITNCSYRGSVSGTGDYIGGLVGENDDGTITNCYSAGSGHGRHIRRRPGGSWGKHQQLLFDRQCFGNRH